MANLPDTDNEIDLSGDKGVLKRIISEGSGDELAPNGFKVSVHYTGTLLDGTQFDSSVDRNQPFEFTLGKGSVIKAFDMGVATMKLGEKCMLTCAPEYAYGKTGSPPNIPPNATLKFELEMLEWKEEDRKSSKSNKKKANFGDSIKILLVGKYEDRIFEERSVDFTLGSGGEHKIVEDVEIFIETMRHGETSNLILNSSDAFGPTGNEEFNIPSNVNVEYTITLNDVEPEVPSWKFNEEESLEQAVLNKENGTKCLKENKFKISVKFYNKSNSYLSNCNSDESKQVKMAVFLNLALAQQKLNDHDEVKKACNVVLEINKNNIKALYRRGQSYLFLGEIENALADFNKVIELEPTNKAALNQITICKQKIKNFNEQEKKLYAKMFDRFANADNQKDAESRSKEPDILSLCGEWTEEMDENQIEREYNEKEAEYQKQKHNIIMLNEGNELK